MTRSNRLTKSLRNGVAAILVATTVLGAAAPAQAANFSFSLNFGNGGIHFNKKGFRFDRCDTNREIRQKLRQRGFRAISFHGGRGNWVRVKADGYRFEFVWRINRCNGKVYELSRKPHRWNRGPGRNRGGNWGGNWGGHGGYWNN